MTRRTRAGAGRPAVPVGGGVPVDPETGERFGYLPRKAARRKIIIRRTLGMPWIIAAVTAALLIAVAGTAFLLSNPGRPDSRYADEGALAAYPAGAVTPLRSGKGWVDRRSGLVVWLTREPFCDTDGGWGAGPSRWDAAGAGPAGNLHIGDSLVAKNRLFVDPQRSSQAPASPAGALSPCPAARPVTG